MAALGAKLLDLPVRFARELGDGVEHLGPRPGEHGEADHALARVTGLDHADAEAAAGLSKMVRIAA